MTVNLRIPLIAYNYGIDRVRSNALHQEHWLLDTTQHYTSFDCDICGSPPWVANESEETSNTANG